MPLFNFEDELYEPEVWHYLINTPIEEIDRLSEKEKRRVLAVLKSVEKRRDVVRRSWTPKERAGRVVGNGDRIPWTVPEYSVEYVSASVEGRSRRKHKQTKIYKRLR